MERPRDTTPPARAGSARSGAVAISRSAGNWVIGAFGDYDRINDDAVVPVDAVYLRQE
jgi:hypothetical protein